MVVAYESMFSRTSLGARPQNLHTFSKVNAKYIQHTCPVGQVFTCPSAVIYKFYLPGATGQAPMLSSDITIMLKNKVSLVHACSMYQRLNTNQVNAPTPKLNLLLFPNFPKNALPKFFPMGFHTFLCNT